MGTCVCKKQKVCLLFTLCKLHGHQRAQAHKKHQQSNISCNSAIVTCIDVMHACHSTTRACMAKPKSISSG